MSKFELDDDFIQHYVGAQPAWGPIGYVTYKRTYSRDLDRVYPRHRELGERAGLTSEEFWLTLVRVTEGTFTILRDHCRGLRLPWNEVVAQRKAQEMFRGMWAFRWTPPGRGLWTMGAPIVDKVGGGCLANCGFFSTQNIDVDFAEPFCSLMDFSMLGVGVGFDTRGAGKVTIVKPELGEDTHVVADSREGWVELLRRTLRAFVGIGSLPARVDVSGVRLAGSPILGFGGTASGPEALLELYHSVVALLRVHVGELITSEIITDIGNMEGRCVVAGNVRRSAEIVFGHRDDEAFMDLKDKNLHPVAVDAYRWASNNSILAKVGQSYERVAKRILKNGEPGLLWLENAQRYGRMIDPPDDRDARALGANPCNEQTLFDKELCVLVETYPFNHANVTEYLRTLKFAYLYAKAVTLVPTHNPATNAVMMMNRRIGCSMSGIVQAMQKFGRRAFLDLCDRGYAYIRELDKEYSEWLCVPQSIKTTSVKPGGTTPLLPGLLPGVHHPHSEYYWRVIRFATDSPMLPTLRAAGYPTYEIDQAKEPNTTAVYFPVRVEGYERGERDVSMWEQLELAAAMQAHWADNQVSVTIKFDRGTEGPQIARALELMETRLKGVAFLPRDDHGYDHVPYQEITKTVYEAAVAGLRPLNLAVTRHEVTEAFCDGDKCVMSEAVLDVDYDAKVGAKRWAAVLDGEAKPLTPDELLDMSAGYVRGYFEYREASAIVTLVPVSQTSDALLIAAQRAHEEIAALRHHEGSSFMERHGQVSS